MIGRRWGFIGAIIFAAMFLFFQKTATAEEVKQAVAQEVIKDSTPEYIKLANEGRALLGKGDAAGAKGVLERAHKLAPKDSGVMRSLADAYIAANSDDTSEFLIKILSSDDFSDIKDSVAREYYALAQKKDGIDPALKKLEAIGKKSKNVGLHRSIAEGYVRLGDWPKVAEVYENLVKDNPKDSGLSTRLLDAYMLSKNYEGAIKMLEPAVKANPNDVGSTDVLAQAYVRAGENDKAVALYKEKLAKDPNSPGLRGRYAQALMDLGMPEESLAEWGAAFKLDPSNFLFKQRSAEVYLGLGKAKEARKEYVELLKVIPDTQGSFKEMISARIKDIDAMAKKR